MKTKILFLVLLCAFVPKLRAQEPDLLMRTVLENNKELKLAREACQAAILEAGSGNTPPDPQVEFGYLYGKPGGIGNRLDFEVSQQLDFPTAYVHRSKVKEVKISRAELEYRLIRQRVLTEARQLWIEQIYLVQMRKLLSRRLQEAESVLVHVEQKLDAGEVSLLELNQSRLLVVSLEGKVEELSTQLENNRTALSEVAGGTYADLPETRFPEPVQIIPDTLLRAYRLGPGTRLYQMDLRLKEEEKNLALSEHLPKLSAAYYSEAVPDETFRGFRVGISVPLWEKTGTVNKARSEITRAEAAADQYSFRLEKQLMQNISRHETLKNRVKSLENALGMDNISLIQMAMETGEISLTEYFYSSDFYYENLQQLLDYKRDLLFREAELLSVYF